MKKTPCTWGFTSFVHGVTLGNESHHMTICCALSFNTNSYQTFWLSNSLDLNLLFSLFAISCVDFILASRGGEEEGTSYHRYVMETLFCGTTCHVNITLLNIAMMAQLVTCRPTKTLLLYY